MKKIIILLTAILMLGAYHCSSTKQFETLEPNKTADIKNDEGKKLGVYKQRTAERAVATYDLDQNGTNEKTVYLNNGKVQMIDFDANQDGIDEKRVIYKEGKPAEVVYLKDGKKNKPKAYARIEDDSVKYVDLLAHKKRYYFDAEGNISKIEKLN